MSWRNEHSRANWGKEVQTMNPYEKLDHANETWDIKQTAAFLGCSTKTIYRLIRQGKIEGWMKVDGRYRFCPCKLKEWMEKNFNGSGVLVRKKQKDLSDEPQKTDEHGKHDESSDKDSENVAFSFDPSKLKKWLEKQAGSSGKPVGQLDSPAGGSRKGQ